MAQIPFDFDAEEPSGEEQDCSCPKDEGQDCVCQPAKSNRMDLCPQCGNNSLVYESGCENCVICGYSRC